jgi:uncharacterized protein HemY
MHACFKKHTKAWPQVAKACDKVRKKAKKGKKSSVVDQWCCKQGLQRCARWNENSGMQHCFKEISRVYKLFPNIDPPYIEGQSQIGNGALLETSHGAVKNHSDVAKLRLLAPRDHQRELGSLMHLDNSASGKCGS